MFEKKEYHRVGFWLAFVLTVALMAACGGARAASPQSEAGEGPALLGPRAQGDSAGVEEEMEEEEPAEEESAEEEMMAEDMASEPMPAAPSAAGVAAGEAIEGDEALPEEQAPQQEDDPVPPDMMFFEEYGTNPFVPTADDNLSTFAVDVDTGSYTVTRRYLTDGLLPPPEAVRLEEFVNYFDYNYPVPQNDAFGINLEAAPTPFNVDETVVLRVGIQGFEVDDADRPDAVLIFVIDVSGSMNEENRLGAVKQSLRALVNELRPTDMIGLVVYGSNGHVILEPTAIEQGQTILSAIDRLQPEGSTNAEEGLRLAYQLASEYYDADKINRLILCSDGVANVGATGPDAILETVRQQARDGITLTTVGFGMGNFNDVMMEQLADDGDGQYYYVDTQAEAERIFVQGLTGTLLTIGRDAKVQVEFNPNAVTHYRLMGYENRDVADEDFRNDEVDAGEIGAGHSVTALYELVLSEQVSGEIGTVRMRWEDPDSGEVTEIAQSIDVSDVQGSFEEASASFRLAAAVAAFADVVGEGAWAQVIDLNDLQSLVGSLAQDLNGNNDVVELENLIETVIDLR